VPATFARIASRARYAAGTPGESAQVRGSSVLFFRGPPRRAQGPHRPRRAMRPRQSADPHARKPQRIRHASARRRRKELSILVWVLGRARVSPDGAGATKKPDRYDEMPRCGQDIRGCSSPKSARCRSPRSTRTRSSEPLISFGFEVARAAQFDMVERKRERPRWTRPAP
jgi:hypothetical protein